ncbi:MAG: glycosyltransferase family 4 protein [Candidatus Omnitrophica bacterium]|nr:glycosyltransferase family 4 protein [Candidatus Omnitrophota bacterium]
MKILQLTTHLNIGGISTYVVNLARKLKQHHVEVVVGTSGGALTERLSAQQIEWIPVPLKTKNEMHPKVFFSALKLAEIVRREKINLVHAHTRVAQVTAAILRRLSGVPYVTTCHGIYKRRLFRRLFPCWGARVTAISEPVRESLVNDFKVMKNQAILMPNGIDCAEFDREIARMDKQALRRFYGLSGDGVVVGSVARMEKVKGLQYLIQSIPHVVSKHPGTKFLMVGDGKYREELVALANETGVRKHVVFHDAVESVVMPLGLMDIFVHPPTYEEGFGLCILEGMSASKPVVATNVGGIYMMVRENENGFLVPPHDPKALADRIVHLIEQPELRRQMGRRGHDVAMAQFSIDALTRRMIEMYEEVLKVTRR